MAQIFNSKEIDPTLVIEMAKVVAKRIRSVSTSDSLTFVGSGNNITVDIIRRLTRTNA
ncbi:MAG: hypothetical protein NTV34_21175 [Proteobacteria bacterium]|nr:hypothetical protein [Pseudomonadota bacterium]